MPLSRREFLGVTGAVAFNAMAREVFGGDGSYYKVSQGDSVWGISTKAGLTSDELTDFNIDRYPSLASSPDLIQPGWTMKVGPERQDFEKIFERIKELSPSYKKCALENILTLPDGRKVLVPSKAYGDSTYARDTVLTVLGLNDEKLTVPLLSWFDSMFQGIDRFTSVIYNPGEKNADYIFRSGDDQLLLGIAKGYFYERGVPVNIENLDMIVRLIRFHQIPDGKYYSNDDLHATDDGFGWSWHDTVKIPIKDSISYNLGLCAVSLECLKKIKMNNGPSDFEIENARSHYVNAFRKDLGYMPFSQKLSYQDGSALFPEILSRVLLGRNILSDPDVKKILNYRLSKAKVFNKEGRFVGLKVLCDRDGSFLPVNKFIAEQLNGYGRYQNGAVWPLWSAAELCLEYKLTEDSMGKYRAAKKICEMMEIELGDSGKSQEFLITESGFEGWYDPNRSGYSWNALIPVFLDWAGITKGKKEAVRGF